MTRRASVAQRVGAACALLLTLLTISFARRASADVRWEGAWPDADKPVSIDAQKLPRSEAVRRVADLMGWSVVLHAPTSEPVDLHVKNQPASKVLSMLLSDGDYVAHRDGTLISIERMKREPSTPTTSPSTSASSKPTQPSAPHVPETAASSGEPASGPAAGPTMPAPSVAVPRGKAPDRVVTGGNVRVEKGEVVHDVVVFGGSADVLGTATGDVTVIGGSAKIHAGAHVQGDATAVGGALDVEDGASVDGDVGVVGGVLRRGKDARIGGRTSDHRSTERGHDGEKGGLGALLAGVVAEIGSAIASAALLFIFGAMLLALGTRRMDALQAEIATRPMRSLALGVVGVVVFALLLIALTLTIIGIPVAIIGALLAFIAAYAGMSATLTVAGAALLRHKTRNPYVHLALGCFLFMILKALPIVGNLVLVVVVLIGIGTIVATRGAGLVPARKKAP